jgi:dienelactone hydrolase
LDTGPAGSFAHRYASTARRLAAPLDRDDADWAAWRRRLRAALTARLGIERPVPERVDVTFLARSDAVDHRSIRAVIATPGGGLPVWFLVPRNHRAPGPAVVAVHGHGTGVNEIMGLGPDGRERSGPPGYQRDFALSLVRRGFVVAAPELLGFGARREPEDVLRGPGENSCRALSTWCLMLGTTLIGQRVLDVIRTVDAISARPEVRGARVGVFGISGGATAALMAACVDVRIAAAALSGYVSSFRSSVLAIEHCICNIVPGIVADTEMVDVALGIAPRPLVLEMGRHDPLFPFEAASQAGVVIRRGYERLGVPERFMVDDFEGGHEVSGRLAFDFLHRWLQEPFARELGPARRLERRSPHPGTSDGGPPSAADGGH